MNSGNGDSPHGYINAVGSLYYINGVQTALGVTNNNTQKDGSLVQDADVFKSALPYTYTLRDAASLESTVQPYIGAGAVTMTTLQWEKTEYGAENHNYDTTTDQVTKAPTTTSEGELTETCTLCGSTQKIVIPSIVVPTTGKTAAIALTIGENAPAMTFNGLTIAALDDNTLTPEEAYDAAMGQDVQYRFNIENTSNSISSSDKELIAALLSSQEKVLSYNDITLLKKIGSAPEEEIASTPNEVALTLQLSNDQMKQASADGAEVEIIRLHQGKAEKLTSTYDASTGLVGFNSDKFSTYAIVLKTKAVQTPSTNENKDSASEASATAAPAVTPSDAPAAAKPETPTTSAESAATGTPDASGMIMLFFGALSIAALALFLKKKETNE